MASIRTLNRALNPVAHAVSDALRKTSNALVLECLSRNAPLAFVIRLDAFGTVSHFDWISWLSSKCVIVTDTERRVLSPSTVGTLETTRIQNASSESGIMTRRRSKAAGENIPNIPELSSATASTSQNTRKSVRGGAKRTKTSDAPAIALSSGRSSTRFG